MEAVQNQNFVFRILERIVFKLVFVLSGWLQRKAQRKWHLIVRLREIEEGVPKSVINTDTYGIGGPFEIDPDPKYEKPMKSLVNAGIAGDTIQNNADIIQLPRWAQEIQPFLQNQLSDHTRRAYEADLKQFFLFLDGKIHPQNLATLRPEHIIMYRKGLEEGRITSKPMAKTTINRKLAVVKSFLNWLRANQVVKENPAQLVKGYPQNQESSLKGLSDEEAKRILNMPNTNRRSGALHQAILSCLLYLGLRKGELIGLKMGDLDSERGIKVMKVRGKGHRIRILPLTKLVQASLEHYFWVCKRDKADKEAPLFMPTKNPYSGVTTKSMNPNAISYIVARYAKKAGILKEISPHSCRATCISNALDKRATHRSVQHFAGWSTPLMIQRYDKRKENLQNSAAFLVDYEEDEAKSS